MSRVGYNSPANPNRMCTNAMAEPTHGSFDAFIPIQTLESTRKPIGWVVSCGKRPPTPPSSSRRKVHKQQCRVNVIHRPTDPAWNIIDQYFAPEFDFSDRTFAAPRQPPVTLAGKNV